MMPPAGTAALALALVLEWTIREPPERVHPVVRFGRVVAVVDRDWSRPRLAGSLVAAVLPLCGAAVVAGAVGLAFGAHVVVGTAVAGAVVFTTTSLRLLVDVAREIVAASDRDPAGARADIPALVGRDPTALSAGEIRSGAVESAAENLADGLVAPLGAFALLAPISIPLAAGGAAWIKAVNTLDSMLGYRSKPVGWAGARLDDVVMWVPARIGALLIAGAALTPDAPLRARRWARAPSSPNSGWPMATLAAILHVRLEKPGVYAIDPAADLPSVEEGIEGVRIVGGAGLLAYGCAGVIAWF